MSWRMVCAYLRHVFPGCRDTNYTIYIGSLSCLIAYVFLVVSLLFLSSPYPLLFIPSEKSSSSSGTQTPLSTKSTQLRSSFPKLTRNPSTLMTSALTGKNPLISSYHTKLSLISGAVLSSITATNWAFTGSTIELTQPENWFYLWAAAVVSGLVAIEFGTGVRKIGFGVGTFTAIVAGWAMLMSDMTAVVGNVILASMMWVGILLDEKAQNHGHDHDHGHHHEPKEAKAPSTITKSLLRMSEGLPLLHGILIERDSRRIFYFMWYVSSARTTACMVF